MYVIEGSIKYFYGMNIALSTPINELFLTEAVESIL